MCFDWVFSCPVCLDTDENMTPISKWQLAIQLSPSKSDGKPRGDMQGGWPRKKGGNEGTLCIDRKWSYLKVIPREHLPEI